MQLEIKMVKITILPCDVICNGMQSAIQVMLNESCKILCLHKFIFI